MRLIYCVEDESGIRELITLALSTADFDVKGFEDEVYWVTHGGQT